MRKIDRLLAAFAAAAPYSQSDICRERTYGME